MAVKVGSRASRKELWLSFQMSQPWATICIQVPIADRHAPVHIRRKSRYWKALKTRCSTGIEALITPLWTREHENGLYQFAMRVWLVPRHGVPRLRRSGIMELQAGVGLLE